jgi:hypothetical protein
VTLSAFQRALSDLVASPQLCLLVRADAQRHLGRYDLSPRERSRLESVVWQRGMSTSCTLYRLNRITPLFTLLPLTCHLLGDSLIEEAELFWRQSGDGHPEFVSEVERFAGFLLRRSAAGELSNPHLDEILRLEQAINALHFLPRRSLRQALATQGSSQGQKIAVNPLVRLLAFRHEPQSLLAALADRRPPPDPAIPGEFFVILDATGEDFALKIIDAADAAILQKIEMGLEPGAPERVSALRRIGLIMGA